MFKWQRWGYLDMYDKGKKLYDLYEDFNINIADITDANDCIKRIESCIDKYKNSGLKVKS